MKLTRGLQRQRLSASRKVKPPAWFLLLVVLGLAWNLAGVASFLSDVMLSEARLAAMPEAQRALYLSMPAWAWTAYGVAVFSGSLGCLALLLRRNFAVPLLLLSLLAVLLQMFHAWFVARAAATQSLSDLLLPALVIGVAVGLLVMAVQARNQVWTGRAP